MAITSTTDLQNELLTRIIDRFEKKVEAVRELADFFNVGKDAIYRRLRGDTLLTPEEILQLAKKYKISLDGILFEDKDVVFFSFNAFSIKIKSVDDYLANLKANVESFGNVPNADIYYPTNEIPIFYYCFFPELISFKLYVWGRNIWDLEYLQRQAFHHDLIQHHAIEICNEVLQSYLQIDTKEMWSLNLFDNTLNQIEYYANTDGFRNEQDALMLCDKLLELAKHMYNMAEEGKKFSTQTSSVKYGNFELYHNEMISTNSFIYLTSPHLRVLFSIYGSPNYMTSSDERICDYTENWIKKIKARSTPIIKDAAKGRNWFFKGIKRRIENTRNRIENHLGEAF